MKWQEDADGRAVLFRFAIALDADPPPVPLDELLAMNSPIPVPTVVRVVKKASKTLGKSCGPIPTPSSWIVRTMPFPGLTASQTEIERIPPLGIA